MIVFNGLQCKLIVVGDFGKDPDDTLALLIGNNVDAYIATLYPSDKRAQLAKGLLNSLGRASTPVYAGKNPGKGIISVSDHEFDFNIAQMNEVIQHHSPFEEILSDGQRIVIVINAAMTDLDHFFWNYYGENISNIKAIIMQGGYEVKDDRILPNSAANNHYDIAAAHGCFAMIQSYKIPFYIITSKIGYDNPIPASYDNLPAHPISIYLESVKLKGLEELYTLVRQPVGKLRKGLPEDRDIAWFFKNIAKTAVPEILPDTIGHLVTSLNVYDVITLLFVQNPEQFIAVSISNTSFVYVVQPLRNVDYTKWITEQMIEMLT
jgi:hypothetical protein